MCKWGTTVEMEVTIPAHLSHTGEERKKVIGVDACIAPIVVALNAGGITTVASCCGHGHLPGNVILADDTWLTLLTREQAQALNDSIGVNIQGETHEDVLKSERKSDLTTISDTVWDLLK